MDTHPSAFSREGTFIYTPIDLHINKSMVVIRSGRFTGKGKGISICSLAWQKEKQKYNSNYLFALVSPCACAAKISPPFTRFEKRDLIFADPLSGIVLSILRSYPFLLQPKRLRKDKHLH